MSFLRDVLIFPSGGSNHLYIPVLKVRLPPLVSFLAILYDVLKSHRREISRTVD